MSLSAKVKGNVAMLVSKTCSGLNANALRYLLPTWMSAWSGVVIRLLFGSLFFWATGAVTPKAKRVPTTWRQRLSLLAIGFLVYGYMVGLLLGLTYTTPVSSSIFMATEPIWVFLIAVMFMHEKVTPMKVWGLALGLGGAVVIVTTQKQSDVASNPLLGDLISCAGAIIYSIYLVVSAKYLRTLDSVTVNKWTFLGGAIPALITIAFVGWHAPVLHTHLFSTPMLVLGFVLLFPTAVSYFLLDIGLHNLSTTVVALYGNLILIVSAIMSYILGQDRFDWFQLLAMAMIIASVYFVEVAESRTLTKN